ncbi:hypothetical protein [Roseovarius arcticus]|uniref:hypothetical protein n=1 Tax=Roseovarius arcticus TaxID=2547404 RepID=UPI001BB24CA7|nr:hypothetical protein [Roseovarius arcticus]
MIVVIRMMSMKLEYQIHGARTDWAEQKMMEIKAVTCADYFPFLPADIPIDRRGVHEGDDCLLPAGTTQRRRN